MSDTGFTVNDILATDYDTLFEVLNAEGGEQKDGEEDVVIPIEEFMKMHPEI